MRRAIINPVSGILLVFLLAARVSAQDCGTLMGTSPDMLVQFLNQRSSRGHAACVASAINQLGNQHYAAASMTLTSFLDFRWPVGAHQKQRIYVIERDGTSIYPAVNALVQIGTDAIPALLNAISTTSSRESMEVAVSAWMMIHKSQAPAGVALLEQQADLATQLPAKQRLKWAAYLAARNWCEPSDRSQCKAAAGIR